jgi:hypothetical protein
MKVCSKKGYRCKLAWETIQHYTSTQIKVNEELVVRKDIDVNEHERQSNTTSRHKLSKWKFVVRKHIDVN